jgi:hypothetical protein
LSWKKPQAHTHQATRILDKKTDIHIFTTALEPQAHTHQAARKNRNTLYTLELTLELDLQL